MRNAIHKFGKFYSNIMINMIGIFIFVGILSVIFGDYGWAPNENIYAISQFVYSYVIPALIAYAAGNHMGQIYEKRLDVPKTGINHAGGAIAVMAAAGIMIADKNCAILGAMILGPICGLLWKHVLEPLTRKAVQGMEMLTRNLVAAIVGAAFSIAAYYVLTPVLSAVTHVIMMVVDWLIAHKLICLTSVLIEPAKVFFLNNSIHHGILLPLAMQQAEQNGSSMLFLLETNPGPGLGVLLALWLSNRKKRKEYAAYMFVECIGGIHEIYFPEVLANLWLLLALIPGGMAGILCMSVFHVASAGQHPYLAFYEWTSCAGDVVCCCNLNCRVLCDCLFYFEKTGKVVHRISDICTGREKRRGTGEETDAGEGTDAGNKNWIYL